MDYTIFYNVKCKYYNHILFLLVKACFVHHDIDQGYFVNDVYMITSEYRFWWIF